MQRGSPGTGAVTANVSFSWSAKERDSIQHISFRGDLDSTIIDVIRDGLRGPTSGKHKTVVFDMAEVSSMDSSGVRLLLDVSASVEAAGGRVYVKAWSPAVRVGVAELGGAKEFELVPADGLRRVGCEICGGPITPIARSCTRCGSAL